ncbi:hypothetical protein DFJ77DRAFT_455331 [Powellomyces hirtus]|nr:hypothetical protein DFJ77DRAFT_455331 [Powellomyces hirtus]
MTSPKVTATATKPMPHPPPTPPTPLTPPTLRTTRMTMMIMMTTATTTTTEIVLTTTTTMTRKELTKAAVAENALLIGNRTTTTMTLTANPPNAANSLRGVVKYPHLRPPNHLRQSMPCLGTWTARTRAVSSMIKTTSDGGGGCFVYAQHLMFLVGPIIVPSLLYLNEIHFFSHTKHVCINCATYRTEKTLEPKANSQLLSGL